MAAEQRKQFQAQLQLCSQQEARDKEEIEQITRELQRAGLVPSNYERNFASEPSTPPERDTSFSSVFSRNSNRYSMSSFTSPLANTRSSRSNSQIASPPSGLVSAPQAPGNNDALPSRSVPSSRRGSTDRVTAFVPETSGSARRNGIANNRYSMPVTSSLRGRTYDTVPENAPAMDMEQVNTTSFLFDDDDRHKDGLTSPEVSKYLQMNNNNFPILQHDKSSGTLSAASAALDLALGQLPSSDEASESFNAAKGHRWSLQHNVQSGGSSQYGLQGNGFAGMGTQRVPETGLLSSRQPNRYSIDASSGSQPQNTANEIGRPSLPNSYSTNDVPTLKNANGLANITPPKNHSQQFHNHNASLGRIPGQVMNNRQSHEFNSTTETQKDEVMNPYQSTNMVLPSNSPPSSATPVTGPSPVESGSQTTGFNSPLGFNNQPFQGAYGMQLMNMGLNPIMATPLAMQNQMQLLQQQSNFLPYTNYAQQSRFHDGQPRSMQNRRLPHMDGK